MKYKRCFSADATGQFEPVNQEKEKRPKGK